MAEVSNISNELKNEITEFQLYAAREIDVDINATPKDIVTKINSWTEAKKKISFVQDRDLIIGLNVLLAEQYVREFGWHWGEVVWDGDTENSRTCVLSPQNKYSVNGIWWVNEVLTARDSVNFLLGFKMYEAGNVPQTSPNHALELY